MLTESELIRLPYTPDLTEGGIAYACRSLAYTYDRMGGDSFHRLRRIVAGIAVELAFRRYLHEQGVVFNTLGATPFTEPDRYDLAFGRHRCDVKSYLIAHRTQIATLRCHPDRLFQAQALVPLDQVAAEGHRPNDIYLFAFLLGLVAASRQEMERAQTAGQPIYLVHPLPAAWSRPTCWRPLEGLALKSECEETLQIELGGQDAEREFVTWRCELPPRRRILPSQEFYTLCYVHVSSLPTARVGLYSPLCGAPYLIRPREWSNIWVYGMEIWLIGWLTYEQFRSRAKALPAGVRTFPYACTRTRNLAVPMGELWPLRSLLERLRNLE